MSTENSPKLLSYFIPNNLPTSMNFCSVYSTEFLLNAVLPMPRGTQPPQRLQHRNRSVDNILHISIRLFGIRYSSQFLHTWRKRYRDDPEFGFLARFAGTSQGKLKHCVPSNARLCRCD